MSSHELPLPPGFRCEESAADYIRRLCDLFESDPSRRYRWDVGASPATLARIRAEEARRAAGRASVRR